jgi:hypothetical protein
LKAEQQTGAMMKRFFLIFIAIGFFLSGCATKKPANPYKVPFLKVSGASCVELP